MPVAVGDTQFVPIVRVLKNLEREFNEHPDSAHLAWRIARVHAIAFAQGRDSIAVEHFPSGTERELTPEIPGAVRNDEGGLIDERGNRHLQKSIEWYEVALRLDPDQSAIKLGYAWCLVQTGKKSQAKQIYRQLITDEFSESDAMDRESYVATEALLSLIHLLDPDRDQREIDKRYEELKIVNRTWGRSVSPIAIPLGKERRVESIVRDDIEVCFDVDGSGRDILWSWIDPSAGWLVFDFDGRSEIVSGRQMFGDVTYWVFWNNGYEAMASLDDNGDRWLRDEELAGLKIWNDRDCDGSCESDELRSLNEYDVVGLSCAYSTISCNGRLMWESRSGVEYASGETGPSYDIVLKALDANRLTQRRP